MSSNNQVIITKKNKKFEVHENLCVDNDFESNANSFLKSFLTLEEAVKYANKYCNEYPFVEYGYHICDNCLEEKINKKIALVTGITGQMGYYLSRQKLCFQPALPYFFTIPALIPI